MAWEAVEKEMIRALVRTTTEAKSFDHDLVTDALRLLFRLFHRAHAMCTCLVSIEFIEATSGAAAPPPPVQGGTRGGRIALRPADNPERKCLVAMARVTNTLGQLTTIIRASSASRMLKPEIFKSTLTSLEQLCDLCDYFDEIAARSSESAGGAEFTFAPPDTPRRLRETLIPYLRYEEHTAETAEQLESRRHRQHILWAVGTHGDVVAVLSVLHDLESNRLPNEWARGTTAEPEEAPSELRRKLREKSFEFLARFCDGNSRNQEAVFAHAPLVFRNLSSGRWAATTARLMLHGHMANCEAVSDQQVQKIVDCMADERLRSARYVDLLTTVVRGLPTLVAGLPVRILRKILLQSKETLVLFQGDELRAARKGLPVAGPDGSHKPDHKPDRRLAYHHALLQLLADLASGLDGEIEMLIQSVYPLHEVCAHACDSRFSYEVRASVLHVLKEVYAATHLKVAAMATSKDVWQVVTLVRNDLAFLLGVVGTVRGRSSSRERAKEEDEGQRARAAAMLYSTQREASYLERGLTFCLVFFYNHVNVTNLTDENSILVKAFKTLGSQLLRLYSQGGAEHDGNSPAPHRRGQADPRPRFLRVHSSIMKALLKCLNSMGVDALSRANNPLWKRVREGVFINNLNELGELALFRRQLRLAAPSPQPGPLLRGASSRGVSLRGLSRAASSGSPMRGASVSPVGSTPSIARHPSTGNVAEAGSPLKGGETIPQLLRARERSSGLRLGKPLLSKQGCSSIGYAQLIEGADSSDGELERESGAPDATARSRGAEQPGVPRGGMVVASQLRDAYRAALPWLEQWKLDDFAQSVSTFEKCGEEALDPIIGMLTDGGGDLTGLVTKERGLRVLSALLDANSSIQVPLNAMGATQVVLETLAAGGRTFNAALDLGIKLLIGGNRQVQGTIRLLFETGQCTAALSQLTQELAKHCQTISFYYLERRQNVAYLEMLSVQNDLLPSSSLDVSEAVQVLRFLQLICEGHFHWMQNYLRYQDGSRSQHNVLIELINALLVLERSLTRLTINMACQLFATLIELLQGPCPENQHFLISTNLVDVTMRMLRFKYADCEEKDVLELKLLMVQLLLALLEGVETEDITRRIASSLDVPLIMAEMDEAHARITAAAERAREVASAQKKTTDAKKTDAKKTAAGPAKPGILARFAAMAAFFASGSTTPGPAATGLLSDLGFHCHQLLHQIGRFYPAVKARAEGAVSHGHFAQEMGCIEIIRGDRTAPTLEQITFRVPELCKWLSDKSKERVLWEVDRSTPQRRVEDFWKCSSALIHEMQWNERLSHSDGLYWLVQHSDQLHSCMQVLVISVNALIFFFSVPSPIDNNYFFVVYSPFFMALPVWGIGCALVFASAACLLEHVAATVPLTLRRIWAKRSVHFEVLSLSPLRLRVRHLDAKLAEDAMHSVADELEDEDEAESTSDGPLLAEVMAKSPVLLALHDLHLVYYSLALGLSCLGLILHPFFFVPCLFDVVVQNRLLQKVIEAVTANIRSLLLTGFLIVIVIAQFSVVGQLFYRNDYMWRKTTAEAGDIDVDLCADTLSCFMTTFYLGLTYDGLAQGLEGVRDKWESDPMTANIRWAVDLLFYILVIVMLLNIIFGIVIDTFAQQRDKMKQKKEDMENVCFVCGIHRTVFDRQHPIGFEHHCDVEHNKWHYLSFFIYLQKQGETELTGPETYVKHKLVKNDLSFFPIMRTSSITVAEVSNELLLQRIEHLEHMLAHALLPRTDTSKQSG